MLNVKAILDTNVLLAALISPRGMPDKIYRAWRSGEFELVTSTAQLIELKRASRYPKLKAILPAHRVGTMINHLQGAHLLQTLPPVPDTFAVKDSFDVFLVAMAIAANADFLVTGDNRAGLLALKNIGRTQVLTPADFCARVLA